MIPVMILCAGFGSRLKELTRQCPKPMLVIQGKPILEWTLIHLTGLGFNEVIINLHYLPDQITNYFGDGSKWNATIQYSYEEKPLGTAGAVKKAERFFTSAENFLVLYGDVFCLEDYQKMTRFHLSKPESQATIVLHRRKKSNSVVEMDPRNRIIEFRERPEKVEHKEEGYWVNSGLYLFSKRILENIPEDSFSDFPKDIFPGLINKGQMYGYPLKSYRCAVDSPDRLEQLRKDFENNKLDQKIGI